MPHITAVDELFGTHTSDSSPGLVAFVAHLDMVCDGLAIGVYCYVKKE
jgi:hypothetical protein